MSIKKKLKKSNITLGEISEKLKISRPTLDSYINLFDQNEELPKKKYQTIFDQLFSPKEIEKESFLKTLNKFSRLIERDEHYGLLDYDCEKTDLINAIFDKMKRDFKSEDFDDRIYIFINIIISNYKKQAFLQNFSDHVLYLNSLKNIEDISEEEKIFVSNMYELTSKFKNKELKLNEEYYEKFLNRIKELKDKKEDKTKKINEELSKKINEELSKKINMGNSVEDIDTDKLIKKIIEKELKDKK